MQVYTSKFFNQISPGSYESAKIIFSELSKVIPIRSLLDVWGGTWSWCKAFSEIYESSDVILLDWDYIKPDDLVIESEKFVSQDLSTPFLFNRKFDLTICMEVAEHLDEKFASWLVDSLTRTSDIILFSAAIPGQWWTHHVNEQPPIYWYNLFSSRWYECCDLLRCRIWENNQILWWYRQNALIFFKKNSNFYNVLNPLDSLIIGPPKYIIHPDLWDKSFSFKRKIFHFFDKRKNTKLY